jgi:hypothetical protein
MNYFLSSKKQPLKKLSSEKKIKNKFLLFLLLAVFLFSFLTLFFLPNNVFAVGTFLSKKLTISDSRQSKDNVKYTFELSGAGDSLNSLKCIEILFCNEPQWGSCITPTGFDSTGTSKGTWTGLTASSWNLDNSTNGTLKLTNAAGEAPAANVSLEFLGFTNPSSTNTYHTRITTYSDVGCATQVDWGPIPFAIIGSGLSITATVPSPLPPYATIVFKGGTSPSALVTILKNGTTATTFQASSSGNFQKTLTGLPEGIYTFGIFTIDRKGRESSILNYTVTLVSGTTTTISGIFLPPTISLAPSEIGRGEIINISGEALPKSQIHIFVSPGNIVKKTTANSQGRWSYKLDTSSLEIGKYSVKAKAISPKGKQSQFSKTLSFSVQCRGADLNFDGGVDIFDLSILFYFWGNPKPFNICADINRDGNIDIVDFSIMMYEWIG